MKICLIIAIALMLSGCGGSKIDVPISEKEIQKKQDLIVKKKISYIYNSEFDIKYSREKIVWFAPYITKDGEVVSERTISVLPSFPTWKTEKYIEDGLLNKEILNYTKKNTASTEEVVLTTYRKPVKRNKDIKKVKLSSKIAAYLEKSK